MNAKSINKIVTRPIIGKKMEIIFIYKWVSVIYSINNLAYSLLDGLFVNIQLYTDS